MRIMRLSPWAIAVLAIAQSACSLDHTTTTERTRHLDDSDNDGLLEEIVAPATPGDENKEDDGCIIMPEPGDCPVMEWTETHTVKTDANGNVIEESYSVCTQCYEEDGTTPIGDQVCYDEPPIPPDVFCEEYPSMDPTVVCYVCTAADGTIVEDSCYQQPVECASDLDCPDGQVCYVETFPGEEDCRDTDNDGMVDTCSGGGMGDAPAGGGGSFGYCGFPDPCQYVDTLPSDPTGQSCWQCTDPATGEDLGSWCDIHTCNADGSCDNPWEVCEASSGYCVWDDPCDPVAGLPDDPTGTDCYLCVYPEDPNRPPSGDPMDPNGGTPDGMGGSYGWCNVHTCNLDEDCAPRGETCNEETGFCEWVDPCFPVESLPDYPNGVDCYSCKDPATGEDWGGYCNGATCASDADCLNTMAGDVCLEGVCGWSGGCPGDDGSGGGSDGQPPPPGMP
jgi:Cys-rich repeat protein